MTRHRLDWLSLLVGLLGVSVALAALTDIRLGALMGSVGPAVAVAVGVALLLAAVRDTSPEPARVDQATGPAPVVDEQPPEVVDDQITREMPPAEVERDPHERDPQ